MTCNKPLYTPCPYANSTLSNPCYNGCVYYAPDTYFHQQTYIPVPYKVPLEHYTEEELLNEIRRRLKLK
jgi:hypothetical protein